MITKAIIVDKKDNLYKVRIPIYHGIDKSANYVKDEDLPFVSANITPGFINPFEIGDIIYISFEENELSKPFILGNLHLLKIKDRNQSNLQLGYLNVKNTTILSESTSIGEVTSSNIAHLKNSKKNIQEQIDDILHCNSNYEVEYIDEEFNQGLKWVLDSRGLLVNSKFLNKNNSEQIDTLDYIQPLIAEPQIVDGVEKTSYTDTTTPGGPYTVHYSDASNKDRRLRLNWQGSSVIKNDKVKLESGLYARNNWKLHPKLINGQYLAQPEYTWRPSLQGSTNEASLKLVDSLDTEEDKTSENQLYFNDWYPYYLSLNPDGGDVEFGRNSRFVVYDNDKEDGSPTEGIRLKSKADGSVVLITVEQGELYADNTVTKQKVGSNGSKGSGSVIFTYTTGSEQPPAGRVFTSPYIPYYETSIDSRIFKKENLYADYTVEDDPSYTTFYSGYVAIKASILLKVNVNGSDSYFLPLCGEQLIQLGTLKALKDNPQGTSGIWFDLSKEVSIGWNNLNIHFVIELIPNFTKTGSTDLITFEIKNKGNYISVIDISQDNIISMYKAQLMSGGKPAAFNIAINYLGTDIKERVEISDIQDYGEDENIE